MEHRAHVGRVRKTAGDASLECPINVFSLGELPHEHGAKQVQVVADDQIGYESVEYLVNRLTECCFELFGHCRR